MIMIVDRTMMRRKWRITGIKSLLKPHCFIRICYERCSRTVCIGKYTSGDKYVASRG